MEISSEIYFQPKALHSQEQTETMTTMTREEPSSPSADRVQHHLNTFTTLLTQMKMASNQSPNDNLTTPNENAEENAQPSQTNTATANHDTSTSPPRSSQPFPTKYFLVNRVSYFGFVVSLSAPIVNFFFTKDQLNNMGITFNLMMWILFGIIWCGGFAMVMGPIFSLVATLFRLLDVVPALGSSIWVVLSIWLTVEVITDTSVGFPGFLNNLPLFSLIMANGIAFMLDFQLDVVSGRASEAPRSENGNGMMAAIVHSFDDGKHNLSSDVGSAQVINLLSIPCLGASEAFAMAYRRIRDNSVTYLRGENLDEFSASFESWRTEAGRIRCVLLFRRLFCLLGYIIEVAALYFSFVLLNRMKRPVHIDGDDKKPASNPIELLLPRWQIVLS